jgi:hypothetical protein
MRYSEHIFKLWIALSLILLLVGCGATRQSDGNPRYGKISGQITDATTNQPLSGAAIHLIGTNQGSITDSQGKFFILNVPPGWYQIKAELIGYAPSDQFEVKVSPGRTKTKNIALKSH